MLLRLRFAATFTIDLILFDCVFFWYFCLLGEFLCLRSLTLIGFDLFLAVVLFKRLLRTLLMMIGDAADAFGVGLPQLELLAVRFGLRILAEQKHGPIRLILHLELLLLGKICVNIIENLVLGLTSTFGDPRFQLLYGELSIA